MVRVFEIDSSFQLTWSDSEWSPPAQISERVDVIWREACNQNRHLFDGIALSVEERRQNGLSCSAIPYRYFHAQQQGAQIKAALGIKIAAVSGLLIVDEMVFVGRRSESVTQYGGLWELAPSGTISSISDKDGLDFKTQLVSELTEEVGIASQDVAGVHPCLLVYDEDALVYDVCCRLTLKHSDCKSVLAGFNPGEYTQLQAYSVTDLQSMMAQTPDAFVPTSIALVEWLAEQATIPVTFF